MKALGHDTEHPRREVAQQVLDWVVNRFCDHRNSSGGPLMTWRTSIGMPPFIPGAAGAAEARKAILQASSALSTSTIQ